MQDLSVIPFTRDGTFLRLTTRNHSRTHRVMLGTAANVAVSRKNDAYWAHDFFEFGLFFEGTERPYQIKATPVRLDLIADGISCAVTFQDADTLRFSLTGGELRLLPAKPFALVQAPRDDLLRLLDEPARGWHHVRSEAGTTLSLKPGPSLYDDAESVALRTVSLAPVIAGQSGGGSLRFSAQQGLWPEALPDFTDCLHANENRFAAWMRGLSAVLPEHRASAEEAWSILWSCIVPAAGQLTRPVLFMSKFWMNKIWAWDNTFNALALVRHDPDLAWDQLHLFFDHQAPNGVIPDTISDLEAVYLYVKPPVYGWAILRLLDRVGETAARPHLEHLFEPVARLTEWWFTHRDQDGDGVCEYHHGNDSGWDNGTAFDGGFPCEAPDLETWLILQCEALVRMATILGKPAAVIERWRQEADTRLQRLLAHCVKDGRFVATTGGSHAPASTGSLLLRFPIQLGRLLPADVYRNLLEDLKADGSFLTQWGLASESIHSENYAPDGYWRGPIWSVNNFLFMDALAASGEITLARELARRACALCVEHPGFWENYDAITGKGLRCPAYTWTAATFLLMAEWLAQHPSEQ